MTTATVEAPAAPAAAPTPAAPKPPAPSPAPAAPAAPAAPTPPAPESLFKPTEPPAAAPAPDGAPAWVAKVPEKFRANGEDGKPSAEASLAKMADSYTNLERRVGGGDVPPENPDGYKAVAPPEAFKDVPLDDELSKAFRERAHKAGLTQQQYEFFMGEYYGLVPTLLDAKAAHNAAEARSELSKVWKTTPELEAGMSAAERAVNSAPEALRQQLKDRYGTDPLFWQFAAHYGKQMSEDRPPAGGAPAAPSQADELMKSEAYTNPKHPDHARVSAQVRQHFESRFGSAPAM